MIYKLFTENLIKKIVMIMEETVKQRLIIFIRSKNLSQAKFEKLVGLSNGFVNNISKGIGAEKLQRILSVFPELNQTWLLTGNGEMLISKQPKESNKEIELYQKLIASLEDTVASQKLIIDKLQKEIIRLQRAAVFQDRNGVRGRMAASAIPDEGECSAC